MLFIVLILQAMITMALNQCHQAVVSQMYSDYRPLPPLVTSQRMAQLTDNPSIRLITQTPERQYFSAQITLCEEEECADFIQFFSVGSAILKEDIRFHAVRSL